MKNLKCPESPEEVTPAHNEFVATEILGWKKEKVKLGRWDGYAYNYFKDNEFQCAEKHLPDFFTNIQHSKMLDEFLDSNTHIEAYIRKSFYCYKIFRVIKKENKFTHKLISDCISEQEAFARTSCIWKAKEALGK